ncbi:alpha/beta hydrolase [Sulfitobacter sp. S223]|uniref:alpha/beta fold hydrolase n=1 Tax=Sulfitobacter sp. S223 TaxID=2867023 RepID=UPI0021A44CDB|nr:alpha/beta hydrolase [Sulfitobacter sp. S223]UWR26704.1 alpha/beta hydrolase [Sulfitobacter sp. S223]
MTAPRCTHTVEGWNGVSLYVPEYGNANGIPVILVHGWSQAHQSWARQFSGPLADHCRLIVPDLRGHGLSDKPADAEAYNNSAPWAGDLHAIIETLGLERPLLIGWSMGGWVVQDYLRVHGDGNISGFSLIGSSGSTGRYSPVAALGQRENDTAVRASDMYEEELGANLAATLAFLKACFATLPDADDLAIMTGFNMLCPPHVRLAARKRHEDYGPDLAKTSVPALVQWGIHERLAVSPMPEKTVEALPNGRAIKYTDSGHAPFWEETEAFNADLLTFAQTCYAKDSHL